MVDLGAGPEAVVARHMIKSGVQARWLAIEPYYSVKAPPQVAVVRGDLKALFANSVDVILFNPPVVPHRCLDALSPNHHLFSGGTDGVGAINEALTESERCLRRDGKLIVLCPTFLESSGLLQKNPRVLAYDYESFESFASRTPLHHSKSFADFISDMQECSHASAAIWKDLGIPSQPDSFAIAALKIAFS